MRNCAVIIIAAAAAIGAPAPLMAQALQATSPGSTQAGGLDTITVTAEKRSENIQKVAATVVAFNSKLIDQLQLDSGADLTQVMPGLDLPSAAGSPSPSMRGLAIKSSGPWQEPTVAFYVDGVYYAQQTFTNLPLNNLQDVEVLKGPQGTLYGRNALGGIISYVTKDPSQDPRLDVRVGYGNYSTWDGNLYATTGITDNLAADISITGSDQQGGWGTNLYNGDKVHTGYDFSARSKWVWTPTDSTKITFSGDYGIVSTPEDGFETVRGELPFITIGPSHVGSFYDEYLPTDPKNIFNVYGGSLKAQQDFGWGEFLSLSALRGDIQEKDGPCAGFVSPYLPLTPGVGQLTGLKIWAPIKEFDRTFTQEFQLASPNSSPIKWIGGAYAYINNAGFSSQNSDQTIATAPAYQQNTVTFAGQKTASFSGFAQGTVPIFADDTRLTGGVRYTSDHRTDEGYQIQNTSANQNVYTMVPGSSAASSPEPSGTWSKATYKAGLDHDITDDILAYFSFTTGFQSAYYNLSSPSAAPIQPEFVNAYEVGLKSDLFNNKMRLNTALFLYDIRNAVATQTINGVTVTTNAAAAQSKGFDIDATVAPIQNLTLTAGLEYLDAVYTSYPNAQNFVAASNGKSFTTFVTDDSGVPLEYSEKVTATVAANYVIPTNSGDFGIEGSVAYHSGMHFDFQNLNTQPAYVKVNAALTWTASDGRWDVKLWGKNLTNAKVADFLPSNTIMEYSAEPPLTFGIRFGFHTF